MEQTRFDSSRMISYMILYGCSVIVIFPFVWLLLTTFKTNIEILSGTHFLPSSWNFSNYIELFTQVPMFKFIQNSFFVTVLATAGSIFASAMAAFVFAKLLFKGKDVLFSLVLLTMMIPGAVLMIPLYLIIKNVGLIDSLWALILPHWTGTAFAIFFLRQHMLSIPHELYEAAKVDGCNPLRIFISIYLPLVRPALATLAVLFFMTHWNDLLSPLIYLNSPDKMTVTVGLSYFRGQFVTNYPVLLAGVLVSLLPICFLFLFAQKYLTRGMLISGIK